MDYTSLLQQTLKQVDGALIISFCGIDGLPVAHATYTLLPPNLQIGDAHVATFVAHKRDSLKQMGITGLVEDISFTPMYVVLIRMISEDYFVSMVCSHATDIKKARYALFLLTSALQKEIS